MADAAPAKDDWCLQPVIDWLVREGRLIADPARFIGEMARRLVAAGAPLARFTLGLQAIHPQYRTMGFEWRRDTGQVSQGGRPHGIENTPDYIGSPIQELAQTHRPAQAREPQRATRARGARRHRLLRHADEGAARPLARAHLHDRPA